MKAIFNISCFFLFSLFIYFCILCSYVSEHGFIVRNTFNIEHTNHQEGKSLQNNFSFEDEESQNDTMLDALSNFLFVTDYTIKITTLKVFIPNTFLSVIWQPPKH